ncbi:MAG: DUF2480 family protein [Balneolaceae bacterium]
MSEIVNKVQASKLITVDLEKLLHGEKRITLDIRNFLEEGLLLREKEYRHHLSEHDWSLYRNVWLSVTCSSDAIVPAWAWMLVAIHADPYAKAVIFGDEATARNRILREKILEMDPEVYRDRFVLLKGCGKTDIPPEAYLEATRVLKPVAAKLMYGEACSFVPVFNRKKRSIR